MDSLQAINGLSLNELRSYFGYKPTLTPPVVPYPDDEKPVKPNSKLGLAIQFLHFKVITKEKRSFSGLYGNYVRYNFGVTENIRPNIKNIVALLKKSINDLGYDISALTLNDNELRDSVKTKLSKYLCLNETKMSEILKFWTDPKKVFLFSLIEAKSLEEVQLQSSSLQYEEATNGKDPNRSGGYRHKDRCVKDRRLY